jgi:preprotein translocase subunit SecD
MYQDAGSSEDPADPQVWFTRTTDPSKIIKPYLDTVDPVTKARIHNPEYLEIIRSWGEPILQGDDLHDAAPKDMGNGVVPELFFSSEGSKKIENWSQRYLNKGEKIAAVLDDVVLNDPPVKDNTVLKESCFIDG